jgi:hypothetical protein
MNNILVRHVEKTWSQDRIFSMAEMKVSGIPDCCCQLWCYEDDFGARGEGFPQADGSLIFRHRHTRFNHPELVTHFIPDQDHVVATLILSDVGEETVRSIETVNACWQFTESGSFGWKYRNVGNPSPAEDFPADFVARCFVFIDRRRVFLKDTRRFPDTREPSDSRHNSPPWVQYYIPVWGEHPGQPQAGWGMSDERPDVSLIGIVSRDGKYLAAMGCRHTYKFAQGWHDCLHFFPDLIRDYDAPGRTVNTRVIYYFLENNPQLLLERYFQDFPV